jgi:hypothetical protein
MGRAGQVLWVALILVTVVVTAFRCDQVDESCDGVCRDDVVGPWRMVSQDEDKRLTARKEWAVETADEYIVITSNAIITHRNAIMQNYYGSDTCTKTDTAYCRTVGDRIVGTRYTLDNVITPGRAERHRFSSWSIADGQLTITTCDSVLLANGNADIRVDNEWTRYARSSAPFFTAEFCPLADTVTGIPDGSMAPELHGTWVGVVMGGSTVHTYHELEEYPDTCGVWVFTSDRRLRYYGHRDSTGTSCYTFDDDWYDIEDSQLYGDDFSEAGTFGSEQYEMSTRAWFEDVELVIEAIYVATSLDPDLPYRQKETTTWRFVPYGGAVPPSDWPDSLCE